MKCKNPQCNNEVQFDKQNNQSRKVFCSNLCCKEFHTDQKNKRLKEENEEKEEKLTK